MSSSKLLAEFGEMHTILADLYFACPPEVRATLPLPDALAFQGAFDHAMLYELLRAWESIAKKAYPLLENLAGLSSALDDLMDWANRRWASEGFLLSANWETLLSLSPATFRDVMHHLDELVEAQDLLALVQNADDPVLQPPQTQVGFGEEVAAAAGRVQELEAPQPFLEGVELVRLCLCSLC